MSSFLQFICEKCNIITTPTLFVLRESIPYAMFTVCSTLADRDAVIANLDGLVWNGRKLNVLPYSEKIENKNEEVHINIKPSDEQIARTIAI